MESVLIKKWANMRVKMVIKRPDQPEEEKEFEHITKATQTLTLYYYPEGTVIEIHFL